MLLTTGLAAVMLTACSVGDPAPSSELANPASVYCEEHGGHVTIVEDADGSERGICVFPDGSQCDEWAYFRGECDPGAAREAPR